MRIFKKREMLLLSGHRLASSRGGLSEGGLGDSELYWKELELLKFQCKDLSRVLFNPDSDSIGLGWGLGFQ